MSVSRLQRAQAPFTPPRPSTAGLNPLCLEQRPSNLRERIFIGGAEVHCNAPFARYNRLRMRSRTGEVGTASGGRPQPRGVVHFGDVSILLTGGSIFTEKAALYLYVPDATGVAQGSPVRVDGIDVGKVGSVALSGSNDPKRVVRLTLSIERNSLAMIPTGSYAELGTDSPVGDKFVDITSSGRVR